MKERYRILYRGGEGEISEKKSRFIATVRPVSSEEEAVSFIADMKKKYWDANHNCSAFAVGENNELTRCSDDGEPAQTAGRPMLDVLLGEGIHNVCVVVTRYFGGTLLGTGGLVRAYQKAVQAGLENCSLVEKCLAQKLLLKTDYSGLGKVQYILGEMGITTLESEFGEQVKLTVLVPVESAENLQKKLVQGTSGRCVMEPGDRLYFGMDGADVILFES